MKKLLISLFFSFSGFLLFAQEEEAIAAANIYAQYAQGGDTKNLLKMTHKAMLADLGGKKKAITLMEQNNELLLAQDISITSTEIGKPFNKVEANGKIYYLVPQYITMVTTNGKMKVESFLIAEKANGKWTFLNTGNYKPTKLEELLPNVARQMVIPEKTLQTLD